MGRRPAERSRRKTAQRTSLKAYRVYRREESQWSFTANIRAVGVPTEDEAHDELAAQMNSLRPVFDPVEGLHEETKEEYGGAIDGITIQYDRQVEPITWEQLTDLPDLKEASPIRNRAQGMFELSPDEYETILALEELTPIDQPDSSTRYFWVNEETFRHEDGATAFYATISPSGSPRLNIEAYKLA